MHRAVLAHEPRAELLQDAVALQEDLPEAVGVLRIVRGVLPVGAEWNGAGDLAGQFVEGHWHLEVGELLQESRVEVCDAACP